MPKKLYFIDYGILIPYIFLSVFGIIMVYSASNYNLVMNNQAGNSLAIQQGLYFIVSLVLVIFIYNMKISLFQKQSFIMAAITVIAVMLVLTRFTGLGVERNGAKGWFRFPIIGAQLQPAEFLKILVIWYLAYIISRRQRVIISQFKDSMTKPVILVTVLIFLVAIQPDIGNVTVLVLIVISMLLSSGINYRYAIASFFLVFFGSNFVIQSIIWSKGSIFPKNLKYIYKRFSIYKNPFSDALGDGHQLINSYYAMSNGGWFGLGLGNSIQKKGFLPEAQTDFIFAIVIEELGMLFAFFILAVVVFLIIKILLVGVRAKSPFNSLMCIGIGAMILSQLFVNIGGITGIIPLTGITFPFISQGGSSLIMLSISIGFVLNINAEEKRQRELEMFPELYDAA